MLSLSSPGTSKGGGKPFLQLNTTAIKDNIPVDIVPGLWLGSIHSGFNAEGLNERFGGRSRSASIIIAFLMSTTNVTYDKALELLVSKRSVVAPNSGFELQLRAYGAAGCDVYGAHQLLLHARLQRVGHAKRRRSVAVFRPRGRGPSFDVDPLDDGEDDGAAELGLPKTVPTKGTALPCPTVRKPAHLRLSRPNSKAVQVIPQLKGLEWAFRCRGCQETLFLSSSILQHKPGRNPSVPLDMSWQKPQTASRDDDEEGKLPPSSSPSEFRPATEVLRPAPKAMVPPTPRAAAMMKKAKSFAFGGSLGPRSADPWDVGGSSVPPTPSHRRGRKTASGGVGDSEVAKDKKPRGLPPTVESIAEGDEGEEEEEEEEEEETRQGQGQAPVVATVEEGNEEEEEEEEAVEVVDDEGDAFDAAMAMGSPNMVPSLGFAGVPSLSLGGGGTSGPPLSLSLGSGGPMSPPAALPPPLTRPVATVTSPAALKIAASPQSGMAPLPPAAVPPLGLTLGLPASFTPTSPNCPAPSPAPASTPVLQSPAATPGGTVLSRSTRGTPPLHPAASPAAIPAPSPLTSMPPPPPPRASRVPAMPSATPPMAMPPTPNSVVSTGSAPSSPSSTGSALLRSAEKTRFVEKMKWLEEAGLSEGHRRTDEEVAAMQGGAGSNALSRRGLRRVRSSTALKVAADDEVAATLHCECVFVEPMQWMGGLHGRSGVLRCPTSDCGAELGFFDWTGASCTCGASVRTPAFCIQLSKVWRQQPSRPSSRLDERD